MKNRKLPMLHAAWISGTRSNFLGERSVSSALNLEGEGRKASVLTKYEAGPCRHTRSVRQAILQMRLLRSRQHGSPTCHISHISCSWSFKTGTSQSECRVTPESVRSVQGIEWGAVQNDVIAREVLFNFFTDRRKRVAIGSKLKSQFRMEISGQ